MKPHTVWIAGAPENTHQSWPTLALARWHARNLTKPGGYCERCHIEWRETIERHRLPNDILNVHVVYVNGYQVNYSAETESARQKEAEE